MNFWSTNGAIVKLFTRMVSFQQRGKKENCTQVLKPILASQLDFKLFKELCLSFSTKAEEVWLEGHFRYLINVPENPSWRGEASKESICNKGNTNQLLLLYEVLLLEEFLSKKTRTVPNWWSFWSCQSIFGLLKLFCSVLCWEVLFCSTKKEEKEGHWRGHKNLKQDPRRTVCSSSLTWVYVVIFGKSNKQKRVGRHNTNVERTQTCPNRSFDTLLGMFSKESRLLFHLSIE